ncbi:indolethylamine N-methyltransferase-like [Anomaloglossus baeobatrachus]|uniref:indolethylamine N-methyltransferase-like n=1 Tax=Anomaloglossus baeobatrachus TaxID=238106 RepID=UPI003F4FD378
MDPGTYTLYHVDGIDSRGALEQYFSGKDEMVFGEDSIIFPTESLIKTFKEGHLKGDILIDLSVGGLVHHLFGACEFFKHIIVLRVRDRCILELKRWVDGRTGAFDWSHVTQLHVDLKGCTDAMQDHEGKVKSALEHVLKCDLHKEDIMDPIVLPLADCMTSALLLDLISRDQEDYMRYLKKFSKLLKPGGHIMLFACLEGTYATIGKEKIYFFNHDEDFVRKALVDAGFVIDNCKVKKRTNVSDLTDYKAIIFVSAHKEK